MTRVTRRIFHRVRQFLYWRPEPSSGAQGGQIEIFIF